YAKTDSYTDLLAAAKRKNSDAEGYITIRDTNISYPIMYDFNWYYNDHDIDRNEIVRGSIYFYWGEPNGNIVITGHNSRTSGTMFHQLHKVQNNKSSLKTYRDRVWAINTYGATGYWEVWSLYEEPAFSDPSKSSQYFNTCFPGRYESKTEQEKQEWIDYQQRKSELGYTVNVTTKDRFMTLLTCGDSHADSAKGSRLYIFLRWVGED
ncbi:MAG: class B sortase, partial [Clostridia bacterium]|nr:class B sortase [Clostridia bacterium]